MTRDQIEKLAAQYAYDTITQPTSTMNIESVIEAWENGNHHKDAHIWYPFEDYDPEELYDVFRNCEDSYLNFAKEILGKELTSSESGV